MRFLLFSITLHTAYKKGKSGFSRGHILHVVSWISLQAINTEVIVCHRIYLCHVKPSQQENICVVINTKLGQPVLGLLPRADFKKDNTNTTRVGDIFLMLGPTYTQESEITEPKGSKRSFSHSLSLSSLLQLLLKTLLLNPYSVSSFCWGIKRGIAHQLASLIDSTRA